MILLPETTLDNSYILAKKIKQIIDKKVFTKEHNLHITCSFGVTTLQPNDTKESFLKRVDEAMYKAKNSGRDTIVKE